MEKHISLWLSEAEARLIRKAFDKMRKSKVLNGNEVGRLKQIGLEIDNMLDENKREEIFIES